MKARQYRVPIIRIPLAAFVPATVCGALEARLVDRGGGEPLLEDAALLFDELVEDGELVGVAEPVDDPVGAPRPVGLVHPLAAISDRTA